MSIGGFFKTGSHPVFEANLKIACPLPYCCGVCPDLAHKRPGSCAGKGLLTEAGLKSPIFYSEDFAIDGAAMLEKLSAM